MNYIWRQGIIFTGSFTPQAPYSHILHHISVKVPLRWILLSRNQYVHIKMVNPLQGRTGHVQTRFQSPALKSRYLSYIFGRNVPPTSVPAAANSCLIMVLQRQQIWLLGSRRRRKLKHGLKLQHKAIWKFGVKLKGEQQSCTWAAAQGSSHVFTEDLLRAPQSLCS